MRSDHLSKHVKIHQKKEAKNNNENLDGKTLLTKTEQTKTKGSFKKEERLAADATERTIKTNNATS